MENETMSQDLNDNKKGFSSLIIVVLLFFLVIGNLYLCYTVFTKSINVDTFFKQSTILYEKERNPVQHVLIISLISDIQITNSSDTVQVKNALSNGGELRVKYSNEGFKYSFGSDFEGFGANDSKSMYWVRGAVINYIASKGWTLVQAPSVEFADIYYYFVK